MPRSLDNSGRLGAAPYRITSRLCCLVDLSVSNGTKERNTNTDTAAEASSSKGILAVR
jgi:hypothetical protein